MFITLEGLDGAGKSTLAQGLAKHYGHHKAQIFAQPWSNKPGSRQPAAGGEFLLDFFSKAKASSGDPYGLGMLLYMTMDRFLDPVVQGMEMDPYPVWEQLTILDRYVDSTVAYQAAVISKIDGDLERWVTVLSRFQEGLFPKPHLTLYLDAGPAAILRTDHDDREILGSPRDREIQALRVYEAYAINNRLPQNRERIVPINASLPPDLVLKRAIQIIDGRLRHAHP